MDGLRARRAKRVESLMCSLSSDLHARLMRSPPKWGLAPYQSGEPAHPHPHREVLALDVPAKIERLKRRHNSEHFENGPDGARDRRDRLSYRFRGVDESLPRGDDDFL
jgi:hypothetical protein